MEEKETGKYHINKIESYEKKFVEEIDKIRNQKDERFISELYNGSGLNYRLLGTCLPTGNTLERAEEVLENGCETHYTYPTINWTR